MIDIVVVNWNSGDKLQKLIDSIDEKNLSLIEKVIIVDNSSVDKSINFIENGRYFNLPIEVIKNNSNKGFGAACNQGAVSGRGKYILFLNPDAMLYSDSLSIPCDFMESELNESVGICGIQLIDEGGHISRSCSRFPSVKLSLCQALGLPKIPGLQYLEQNMSEWDHSSSRTVDQVIGAFFFIRREVFESLNGFDERFFVYYEEVDFSYRAKKAGWSSYYLSSAKAFHEGGGTSSQVKAHRLFYILRSRILYGFKHFSPFSAWVLLLITIFLEPISRSALALFRGGRADLKNTLNGFLMLYKSLPDILAARNK